jgi:hypothetical protein
MYDVSMVEIPQVNIFFIIASFGTVLFILLTSLVLLKVYTVLSSLQKIIDKADTLTEKIIEDMATMRSSVKGSMVGTIIKWLLTRK